MTRTKSRKAHNRQFARKIRDEGIPVFTYAWNSGNPGAGAGVEYIFSLDGQMVVASSEDDKLHGPYDDLHTLFEAHPDLLTVNETTEAIECIYLDAADISTMLSFSEPPPLDPEFERLLPMLSTMSLPKRKPGFTINGEPWIFTSEHGFRPVVDQPLEIDQGE